MIGGLLLLVLLVATIVLIVSSLPSKQNPDAQTSSPDPSAGISDDDGLSTVTSDPLPSGTPSIAPPSPTGPVVPAIESVVITYAGEDKDEFTTVLDEAVQLSYRTVPANLGENLVVLWETSDENVFVVMQTGEVKPTGVGMATLKLTVGGKVSECIVHVNSSW